MPDQIGDPTPTHPLPMRLRNANVIKKMGGSYGYRGKGYSRQKRRAIWLARGRSSATGLGSNKVQLEVDHIDPYRIGGPTPHTNEINNLRVLDTTNNKPMDVGETFREKKRKPRMRTF